MRVCEKWNALPHILINQKHLSPTFFSSSASSLQFFFHIGTQTLFSFPMSQLSCKCYSIWAQVAISLWTKGTRSVQVCGVTRKDLFLSTLHSSVCYTSWNVSKSVKREISTTTGNIKLSQGHLPKSLHRLLFSLLSFTTHEGMPLHDKHYILICMSNH